MAGVALQLEEELAELSRSFEGRPASKIVRWAVDRFHPRLSLLSSMTDAVLIDLAVRVEPSIEVVFIDTGHHFPETLETVDRVRRRYGLDMRLVTVGPEPAPLGEDGCCSAAKVLQLDRALVGRDAWMSGLRRADAPTRAEAPIVGLDRRGLVKVNPLAAWTDDDVAGYIAEHDVPVNPLVFQGYPSVGCRPCTKPVPEGADPRSGRWAGSARTECGIHG
ncbi:MAG: phosphoadenylyl-sulfate reductase [Actinomycetota bacterium]|nr:phosphoadenylyl-sulfate reductase [Actinomycetota bacterium]